MYDDKSVLENMHCMLVVRLLRKHGFGSLVSSLPPPTSESTTSSNAAPASGPDGSSGAWSASSVNKFDTLGFRKVLYSSVLATDMSLHFAWIARLKEFGAAVQDTGREGKEEEDRIMISQAIIKCADISNPVSPPPLSPASPFLHSSLLILFPSSFSSLSHFPPSLFSHVDHFSFLRFTSSSYPSPSADVPDTPN